MIVLNETKVKYETLDDILSEQLKDIRYNGLIHVVVDLKEVFRKIYRPGVIENSTRDTITELTSDVINIIGHYRNYFFKHYGKQSNYYMLYSLEECKNIQSIYPNYKKEFYERSLNDPEKEIANDVIKTAWKLMNEIVPRIPNVTLIDTSKYDEFVYTRFIRKNIRDNQRLYILTDDELFVQLLSHNTSIINMKGADNTKLITPENYAEHYFNYKNVIPVNLSPIILSMGGVGRYSLNRVPNVGQFHAARIVHKYYNEGKLVDSYYNSFPLDDKILDEKNKTEQSVLNNLKLLNENYKVVNGSIFLFPNTDTIKLDFMGYESFQPKSYFLDLNAKIFNLYPLNLNLLFRGEDGYEQDNPWEE